MPPLLTQTWDDIRERYKSVDKKAPWAIEMLELVDHITGSPVGQGLYPWTSMFDLIISQTPNPDGDAYPLPHLRISPLQSGKIEFRYVDTPDRQRQWVREVEAIHAKERFDTFVDQLGWLIRIQRFEDRLKQ